MNGNFIYPTVSQRTKIFGIDRHLFKLVQGFQAVNHSVKSDSLVSSIIILMVHYLLSENSVLEIQTWLGSVGYEKLARICVRSTVGHGYGPSSIVLKYDTVSI